MKKKVKFTQSISGLGDPDKDRLNAEYDRIRKKSKAQGFRDATIERIIEDRKVSDRYNEKPIGFKNDFSFKPEQEAYIPADLAEKWEESGICVIVPEPKKAAA